MKQLLLVFQKGIVETAHKNSGIFNNIVSWCLFHLVVICNCLHCHECSEVLFQYFLFLNEGKRN